MSEADTSQAADDAATGQSLRGSCLCGAVRFEVGAPFRQMVHCHCSRCRKANGASHATSLIVNPGQLRWLSSEASIVRFDLPTATSFGKWFCRHCGSPLPRLTRSGTLAIVPAGLLDTPPPISPSDHIFWASRAPWTVASDGLPTHDEYPETW